MKLLIMHLPAIFRTTLPNFYFFSILSKFRIQTQSAVSAVHSLLQSVEAALPKQKKNMAVTKFKHAMVVHKRRCKAH